MVPRIYIDTSVIGGCLDDDFARWSISLFEEFRDRVKIAVVSDLTMRELELAPKKVRQILLDIPSAFIEHVFLTDETIGLANSYIVHNVVSEKYLIDAQHIAIATVERVDALVSWNFKHIVNLERIRRFNAVNMMRGYPTIEIRSPMEVLYEEEI